MINNFGLPQDNLTLPQDNVRVTGALTIQDNTNTGV